MSSVGGLGKRSRKSDGSGAARRVRVPNKYSLRWLTFAAGDEMAVTGRSPTFDQVFAAMINAFVINQQDNWEVSDAHNLCVLAMMTLFYLKYVFMADTAEDVGDERSVGEDDDDEDEQAQPEVLPPLQMLTKICIVVGHVQQIFNFAGGLKEEIPFIRTVQRYFQSAFGTAMLQSRSQQQQSMFNALKTFCKCDLTTDDFMINDEQMTMNNTIAFFNASPPAVASRAAIDSKKTMLARTASMSLHVNDAVNEIKGVKAALMDLARMVSRARSQLSNRNR